MIVNKRTCALTKTKTDKENLIRIVRTKEGKIFINSSKKGRGVYLLKNADYNLVYKNRILNKAFKMEVPLEKYLELKKVLKGKNEK